MANSVLPPSARVAIRSKTEPMDRAMAFPNAPQSDPVSNNEGKMRPVETTVQAEATMSTLSRHQSWYHAVWAILQHASFVSAGDKVNKGQTPKLAYMLYGARAFNLHLPSKVTSSALDPHILRLSSPFQYDPHILVSVLVAQSTTSPLLLCVYAARV